ncbi:hypothetical protein NPIL_362881 [Nephila pilipes]|uniref:Uncharacterized protein n=1 Tax=Nephila pilipes TaxID=299642 RepID=A0A8X6P1P4_NEPPI|nr:hypothetical protein NPIL_362881 [Nephila pilipes]
MKHSTFCRYICFRPFTRCQQEKSFSCPEKQQTQGGTKRKALENQTISNVGAEAAAPLVLERVCKQGRDSTPVEHALQTREMLAFGRASCVKNRLRKQ